jgi:NAD(P)-dependent dehydrogenase (short-subunit alcohol dehydrogenase family)
MELKQDCVAGIRFRSPGSLRNIVAIRHITRRMRVEAKRFLDKVVIITGAGRGMGKATALAFAREGAKVAVTDVSIEDAASVAEEIRELGQETVAMKADVSDMAQVSQMVDAVLERFGTVDILVNNAGVLGKTVPLESISGEEWARVININLTGVFNCTKAVLPAMKKRKKGKIVNVSSSAGRSFSTFGAAHYTASKAGVLGLTRHTANEAAAYNINVNAVTPGSMDTEMVRLNASPEHIAQEEANIPLGRLGTPEEEAYLVLFLASEEASYITGATVDINGGDLMI